MTTQNWTPCLLEVSRLSEPHPFYLCRGFQGFALQIEIYSVHLGHNLAFELDLGFLLEKVSNHWFISQTNFMPQHDHQPTTFTDTSSTCSPHFSTFLGVAKAAKALTHRGPKESHPHSRAGEHLNDHPRSSAVPIRMDLTGSHWGCYWSWLI